LRISTTLPSEHTAPNEANYGVIVEPVEIEKLEREIGIFAEIEIKQRQQAALEQDAGGDAESDLLQATELKRAIRGLTSTTHYFQDGQNRDAAGRFLQPIDPVDQLVAENGRDRQQLTNALLEKAQLESRTQTTWWFSGDREQSLRDIKGLLSRINQGDEPTASLPYRVTLWRKKDGSTGDGMADLSFIDTLGFDGGLRGRGDLQLTIKDDRTVVLLCLRFTDHANEVMRTFLKDAKSLPFLNISPDRVRMAIIDWNQAEFTADANGDSKMGQWNKLNACTQVLNQSGLVEFVQENGKSSILVINPYEDEVAALSRFLHETSDALWAKKKQMLEKATAGARDFLDGINDGVRTRLTREVDQSIQTVFMAAKPRVPFLPKGIGGLIELVSTNHVKRVHAMCRRAGEYDTMNAYDAVYASVEQLFQSHCKSLVQSMHGHFDELRKNNKFANVVGHIDEQQDTFDRRMATLGTIIARTVREEIRKSMRPHQVWTEAENRWGCGKGYRDDVNKIFENWSSDNEPISLYRELFRITDFGLTELPSA
jgi:hypothetical protein